MSLAPGTRLGPYEIRSPIGEGGMGEVYRGVDTRLDRSVAIKVVKGEFTDRFEREARAVAALSHPNICALYDVGENFLAMEYIEGAALAGPLPIDKALVYARQILDALEAAHRKGIVHRDLKPANILVTKSGIKLLDFGLAKMERPKSSTLPDETLTQAISQQGMIAGTLQYMPPEQLQGKDTDVRADIFAFGCVFYEMLTGRRAFEGENAASVITAVMTADPAPASSIMTVPQPALDRIIRNCMAKDPDERWQSAHDIRIALDLAVEAPVVVAAPKPPARRNLWPWAVGLCLVLGSAAVWFAGRGAVPPAPFMRFEITPPPNTTILDVPSISPDGKTLAFVASGSGSSNMIYLRPLDAAAARVLPGTEGALFVFWSPDSRSLGFTTRTGLKRIDLSGGASRTLFATSLGSQNGSWNQFGDILFYPIPGTAPGAISRVSDGGGPLTASTRVDRGKGEGTHRFPQFLPDGKHFLVFIYGSDPGETAVDLAALGSFDRKSLLKGTSAAIYGRDSRGDSYLLYVRDDTLLAQKFDEASGALRDSPSAIADDVGGSGASGHLPNVSVSSNGALVYTAGARRSPGRLVWHDRHGKVIRELPASAAGSEVELSPDDHMLAVQKWDPGTRDQEIWITDLRTDTTTRITFGPGYSITPIWSPDAKKIAFGARRKGKVEILVKDLGGNTADRTLAENALPQSWSSDGKTILAATAITGPLTLLPLDGGPRQEIDIQRAMAPRLSPDGRFIAYSSSATAPPQIFVISTPPGAGKWQVSTDGGFQPIWRRDGKELFFVAPDGALMATDISVTPSFRAGVPQKLFSTGMESLYLNSRSTYAASADGQRFLIRISRDAGAPAPIHVMLNWPALLKKASAP